MTNEDKAKQIIEKILYITIATCSKDNLPWNSPVYSSYDENHNFFWASPKDAQHSKNIRENENIFIVIYDSTVAESTGKGVYIRAKAYELTEEEGIKHAIKYHYSRKNQSPRKVEEFLGNYPRRFYKAVPEKIWINEDTRINGNFVDFRTEVDLLNK